MALQYKYAHKNSADIDKSVQTYNIIVGLQANLSKHLFVELFSGLGVKLITIHRTNIIDDINTHDESPWITLPTGIGEDRIDEQGGTINIPFSIKLCYTL